VKNQNNNELIIRLKISPNSSKNELVFSDEGLKIKLTAQPIENKANKMLVEFLSKSLKFPKTSISIIKGETSKEKTLLFKYSDETQFKKLKEFFKLNEEEQNAK